MGGGPIGSHESVFWVNRFSGRSVRKILLNLRVLKPSKEAAMTTISIAEIDALDDEQLRDALKRQLQFVS